MKCMKTSVWRVSAQTVSASFMFANVANVSRKIFTSTLAPSAAGTLSPVFVSNVLASLMLREPIADSIYKVALRKEAYLPTISNVVYACV